MDRSLVSFSYLLLVQLFVGLIGITTANDPAVPCGVIRTTNRGIQARIFGGTDAYYGQVPWIISLYENGIRVCGGTLISNRFVLTVAHCVEKRRFNKNMKFEYTLLAGDHFSTIKDEFEQTRTAVRIFDNEDYDHVTLENDIALIEVNEPFVLNDHVVPACLPKFDETPFPFSECTASGWGYASSFLRPDTLQILMMPNHPHKHCEIIHHPRENQLSHFTQRMMCAGYLKGGKDTCKGDSGGPLTCIRFNDTGDELFSFSIEEVITGIISWGRSCGLEGTLPVFTRVESYIGWINEIISLPPMVSDDPCTPIGVLYNDRQGDIIKTPGYGETNYAPNLHCLWRYDMSAFSPKRITIVVEDFELEKPHNGSCTQDYLKIYVGAQYDKLVGDYCENMLTEPIVLESARGHLNLKFEFESDFSINAKGFHISFTSE